MANSEEIIQMREKLKHEGFEPSDKLPPDWLYKEVSSSNYQRLVEDGNLIELVLSANEDMKSSGVFSSTDSKIIQVFGKEKAQGKLSTVSNWQKDKNMPKGWTPRLGESTNGNIFFLSPDGQQFTNRKGCLQYILKQEGWEESQYLPHGWMLKNTKHKTEVLLSRDGERVRRLNL